MGEIAARTLRGPDVERQVTREGERKSPGLAPASRPSRALAVVGTVSNSDEPVAVVPSIGSPCCSARHESIGFFQDTCLLSRREGPNCPVAVDAFGLQWIECVLSLCNVGQHYPLQLKGGAASRDVSSSTSCLVLAFCVLTWDHSGMVGLRVGSCVATRGGSPAVVGHCGCY